MDRKKIFKFAVRLLVLGFILGIGFCWFSNYYIINSTEALTYTDVEKIPARKVGLLLGASTRVPAGRNLFMLHRLTATKKLYDHKKIEYVLISGDNSNKSYNEPEDIRLELIQLGIPEDKIILDYAGFRTLDSVIRAKEIFGQREFTIISQKFQNERAIFIAQNHNIDAIGFNAREVSTLIAPRVYLREYLARVAAILDVYILQRDPKFYGEQITIPLHEQQI